LPPEQKVRGSNPLGRTKTRDFSNLIPTKINQRSHRLLSFAGLTACSSSLAALVIWCG
jgi:hypothetical protein